MARQPPKVGPDAPPPAAPPPEPAPVATAHAATARPASPAKRAARGAHVALPLAAIGALSVLAGQGGPPSTPAPSAPAPIVAQHEVQWWAAFKFNAVVFPTSAGDPGRACTFGGAKQSRLFSQQYVVASSQDPTLKSGPGLIGTGSDDPLGATYGQLYNGAYHYVVWNDQFKGSLKLDHCSGDCDKPWGHSKGMLAWDDAGDGVVLQVTTPAWPRSGSAQHPADDNYGNTLGCITDDNVEFSQDFFALKLTKDDLVQVLKALANASVVTDPSNLQLVSNGGPSDVQALVQTLGVKSTSVSVSNVMLSSGVRLISKPSSLNVPPWQMVSAQLGGVPLKVANWWTSPAIPDTTAGTAVSCWDPSLGAPGAVVNARFGQWGGKRFGLQGGAGPLGGNHAKVGVSTDGAHSYAIFGDMNQQGALNKPECESSQDDRGGLFFVLDNSQLAASVSQMLTDPQAPAPAPAQPVAS